MSFDPFCDQHFRDVVGEIQNQFELLFFGVLAVEVIHVKPQLMAVLDNLTTTLALAWATA
jgi:hypothetical protein